MMEQLKQYGLEMLLKEKLIEKIVNKQFEMAGFTLTYKQIPESGIIEIEHKNKTKAVPWYEVYQFPNEEMYLAWRKWMEELLEENDITDIDWIDLTWGMSYKYEKKKGQLELL